jgi:long-chain acyl-CoA synthetase
LTAIGTARISFLVALPAMYGAMLDYPHLRMFDLSRLRICIYAMAPMPQPMLRRLIETICPRFALCSGQTEMYSITTMFKPEQQLRRAGPYWGESAAVCETAIMDDAGRLLGPGKLGEIVHRGPNAMLGYYKDPDATAEAQRFGWHHTGDLGLLDADGQLLFVDRKKDIIVDERLRYAERLRERILFRVAA